MNIKPVEAKRESMNYRSFNLTVDNAIVGGMHQHDKEHLERVGLTTPFHAWVNIPFVETIETELEGQGFGATQEEAIKEALTELGRQVDEIATAWAVLQQKLGV